MNVEDVLNEVYHTYEEWIETLPHHQASNFVIEQLARRVVMARQQAEQYKMALKRRDLIQETR